MYPHRIRLRGPWECEPLQALGDLLLPGPRRMNLPCRWAEAGLVDFAGLVRFRRRFGYPGRIDDCERVWLTFAAIEGSAAVWLNGIELDRPVPNAIGFEYCITSLLQPRNELVVEVNGPVTGGIWGAVALEVRRSAFLRAVQVRPEQTGAAVRLRVSGEVVGSAGRPLEIYVVLGRSTVAYGLAEAAAEGRPFVLHSEALSAADCRDEAGARVDLVDGAVVWYTVEQAVDIPALPGE